MSNYLIRTYANTKAEFNTAKQRLDCLLTRKAEIYTRFFPLTPRLNNIPSHTNKKSDPMADYIHEITKINDITGMSLEEEIENARNESNTLEYFVKLMEYNFENITGIENELFKKIIIDGYKPTKAVNKIAEKHNIEPITIWKYHYPKIKPEISKCIVKV